MQHRTLSFLLACVLGSLSVVTAQDVDPGPAQFANWRADSYGRGLGIDARTMRRLAAEFEAGEVEVFELRQQVMELEERIERIMSAYDANAVKLLSKEDQRRLKDLQRLGWAPSSHPQVIEVRLPEPDAGRAAPAKPATPTSPSPNATFE
jgi:hypothetical protein